MIRGIFHVSKSVSVMARGTPFTDSPNTAWAIAIDGL